MEASQRVQSSGSSQPPPADRGGTVKRVLLVANEAVTAPEVLNRIKELAGEDRASVFVVAPALTSSPLKLVAGEVDGAIEGARLRLDASLRALRAVGFEADGEVGDSDPNIALEDAL